jgi:hypothetical protein
VSGRCRRRPRRRLRRRWCRQAQLLEHARRVPARPAFGDLPASDSVYLRHQRTLVTGRGLTHDLAGVVPVRLHPVLALAICNLTSKRRSENASRYIPMSVGVLTPCLLWADVSVAAMHPSLVEVAELRLCRQSWGAYAGNLAPGTGVGSGVGQPAIIAAAARLVGLQVHDRHASSSQPSDQIGRIAAAGAETPEHNLGRRRPAFRLRRVAARASSRPTLDIQRAVVDCRSGSEVRHPFGDGSRRKCHAAEIPSPRRGRQSRSGCPARQRAARCRGQVAGCSLRSDLRCPGPSPLP